MSKVEIFADSSRGQYIPQFFAETVDRNCLSGVSECDMQTLENGPEDEWYWESWENVLNNAVLLDKNGLMWFLHQDGDLFTYRADLTDEELENL